MKLRRQCCLCGSMKFVPIPKKGGQLRCAGCKSLPRTRMLGLAILRGAPSVNGLPIVHFAPERALVALLKARYGNAWTPADVDQERYRKAWVGKDLIYADLAEPSRYFLPESVGGFIHSHVLEHVSADVGYVIRAMNEAIAPGGFHAFIVPVRSERLEEDLSPSLTPAVRLARFGHIGHVRNFGRTDFAETVLAHFDGWKKVELSELVTADELRAAAIPVKALTKYTGSTVFMYVKPR